MKGIELRTHERKIKIEALEELLEHLYAVYQREGYSEYGAGHIALESVRYRLEKLNNPIK